MKAHEIEIKANSEKAVKAINAATEAANKLSEALDKLRVIQIELQIVETSNPKWWQIWKN